MENNTSEPVVQCSYDKDAGVLYISIGPARPAWCGEPKPGILIRYFISQREAVGEAIVGLTLIDPRFYLREEIAEELKKANAPKILINYVLYECEHLIP